MARRQQRDAGVPQRGRPARCAAAGKVRALPGNGPRQQAQCPAYGGPRRRARERSLGVLSAVAAGGRETRGPAGNRPARIGRGPGTAGDCRAPGRPDQAAAGTGAWIRCEPRRGGRERRRALCRGRDAGRLRPARRPAAPFSKLGDDAARGALGIAARSRLLGPPHAPSADHSAPPSGGRSGHVGNDVPESSRRLAGSRRRQPAVDHLPAPGLWRHLLLRCHPRGHRPRLQRGFAAGNRSPRVVPDLHLMGG